MKLMIASDLHGSAYYTALLLERWRAENAERLVLLGDILYHGPRNDLPREYAPKEVIAQLNPLAPQILAVRGSRVGFFPRGVTPMWLFLAFGFAAFLDFLLLVRYVKISLANGRAPFIMGLPQGAKELKI
jgi:hypothetical protein